MRRKQAAGLDPENFSAWSDRMERRLKQAVWITAVLLVVSQAALQIPALRHGLSAADRLEGVSYAKGSGR